MLVQNPYDVDIRVRRKAEALVAAGYDVDALALQSTHSKPSNFVMGGVHVYTFPLAKKRGSQSRYFYEYLSFFFWAFIKLSLLTRTKAYDVIDVNTLPDFLVFAALYPRLKGAKVLLDMHEITPEFLMSKYNIGPKHWQVKLARLIERASFTFADRVITINEPIQQLLTSRGLHGAKSTIIMNSVDESLFVRESASSFDSDVSEKPKKFVMMYHGTFTRIYGLDIALEAFSLVHEEMPDAEFWIMGDGPEMVPLEKLARKLSLESKVRFIGLILPQDVPLQLARCDIGVLPTRRDVFLDLSYSNKLSEYIIMGKPIIVARLKAIRHYFSEEALAYFQPNMPADLAKQMVRLYRDQELRHRLVERAKLEYAPISWEVMRQRYLALIEDVTRAQHRG
jgi:glycosyltransferase involved in cell wall biosynthesis